MTDFLHQMAGLCLMRLVMEMMLPEGDMKGYGEWGVGLMMTLGMLRLLSRLLQGGL